MEKRSRSRQTNLIIITKWSKKNQWEAPKKRKKPKKKIWKKTKGINRGNAAKKKFSDLLGGKKAFVKNTKLRKPNKGIGETLKIEKRGPVEKLRTPPEFRHQSPSQGETKLRPKKGLIRNIEIFPAPTNKKISCPTTGEPVT